MGNGLITTIAARLNRALVRHVGPDVEGSSHSRCYACLLLARIPADCPHVRNVVCLGTEKREAERRLRASHAELAAARAELDELAYSVSHELRAPARQIASFTGMLVDSMPAKVEGDSAEYLPLIQRAVKRMGRLIDELVLYSRVGRAELRPVEVNARDLVDQVLLELEPAMRNRAVTWRINTLPTLFCDPVLVRQVFTYLLDNALKFTRGRPSPEIEIGCASDSKEHVFHVRDNGAGFDGQSAGCLFRLYQRLHHPGEFEGAGMGLAKVKRIVQRHGGRVWAEGRPGDGATVYFTIPTLS